MRGNSDRHNGWRTISSAIVIAAVSASLAGVAAQNGRIARGNKSVIVMSLKTAGGPASHCSNDSLVSMYFTDASSISAYYAENSYGALTLSGTATGPYVVNLDKDWSRATIADDADAAATAAGVNLGGYSHKVYLLPKEADPDPVKSAWGGNAGDESGSRIWIRDFWCSSKWVAAHELGHNLGVNHASTSTDDYGDYSSSMGGWLDPGTSSSTWNNTPHFNAPQKIAAGWLPVDAVQTVTASGSFQLASVETAPALGQVQTLKIKSANNGTDYYYLSYRQAVGFSSAMAPQYLGTTSVHRWNPGDQRFDTVGAQSARTYLLASLADGWTFTDSSGLRVTQRSHDSAHARIEVYFDK